MKLLPASARDGPPVLTPGDHTASDSTPKLPQCPAPSLYRSDQENPAPTQATCHIHDGALAVLPHTETFIETVLSVLTYSLLLESDMDSWGLGQRMI